MLERVGYSLKIILNMDDDNIHKLRSTKDKVKNARDI